MYLCLYKLKFWSNMLICALASRGLKIWKETGERNRIHIFLRNTLFLWENHERMAHFCSCSFVLWSKMLSCDIAHVELNVEEELCFVKFNHPPLSLCILRRNEGKIVSKNLRSLEIRQSQRNQGYLEYLLRSQFCVQNRSGRAHRICWKKSF